MKAEDLMIGDWVDVYHELPDESGFYKPLQVTGLHQNNGICFGDSIIESPWNDPEEFEEEIKPIPLTEEILEKNGFTSVEDQYSHKKYFLLGKNEYNSDIYWDGLTILIIEKDYDAYICDAEYVHELQHALKLCRIEKEIIL